MRLVDVVVWLAAWLWPMVLFDCACVLYVLVVWRGAPYLAVCFGCIFVLLFALFFVLVFLVMVGLVDGRV